MIEQLALSNFTASEPHGNDCIQLWFGGGSRNRQMVYTVFPGITVQKYIFHMERCPCVFYYADNSFSIDWCREGRIEWMSQDDTLSSLGEREVCLSARSSYVGCYEFSTQSYRGVTVSVQVEKAKQTLEQLQPYFHMNPEALYRTLKSRNREAIIRAEPEIEQIFLALETLCEQENLEGLRIKVLELLLLLPELAKQPGQRPEYAYFPKSVTDKVRAIKEELCRDGSGRKPLAEIAARYQLSESMLKRCFRAMYGNSIYAFVKSHRLRAAAQALMETNRPIMDIAMEAGYENPSKFSAAFRKQYGMSPKEFRATHSANPGEFLTGLD